MVNIIKVNFSRILQYLIFLYGVLIIAYDYTNLSYAIVIIFVLLINGVVLILRNFIISLLLLIVSIVNVIGSFTGEIVLTLISIPCIFILTYIFIFKTSIKSNVEFLKRLDKIKNHENKMNDRETNSFISTYFPLDAFAYIAFTTSWTDKIIFSKNILIPPLLIELFIFFLLLDIFFISLEKIDRRIGE